MTLQTNRAEYTCIRARVDEEYVNLVGFGDLHAGSETYDEKKAKEVVAYIKDENCLWLGMGDMCENSTKRSVGTGVYDQSMSPQEQIFYLKDLLEPIADKCIGYLRGNHEERTNKDSGVDVAQIVAYMINVPYCGWEYFGIIANNKIAYTLYGVHSYKASKSGGLALRQSEIDIESMLGSIDIIMRGHTHKKICEITDYLDIDKYNNAVVVKQRANMITGHYLKRANSYAASKPMRGSPAGTIPLELSFKSKWMKPIYL